jgi:hypothetical protein
MKKQFALLIIILIVVIVGLSGCNENGNNGNGKSPGEEILGAWGGYAFGDDETSIFNFYSNSSLSVNALIPDFWEKSIIRKTIWGTYVITDETFAMELFGDTTALEYSFSDDGKKLNLIDVAESGDFIVLTKYNSPPAIPSIKFLKNDDNLLTVISASPSDLRWSNIEINGDCDTSGLGTYVVAGDRITDCSDTITIRDMATDFLICSWDFSSSPGSDTEHASVAGEGTDNQIKLVLASGGDDYGIGYNITNDVRIFIDGTKVSSYTTEIWEVGGQILLGLNGVNWEEGYTCPEGDYEVTVAIMDTVVFDWALWVG